MDCGCAESALIKDSMQLDTKLKRGKQQRGDRTEAITAIRRLQHLQQLRLKENISGDLKGL